MASKIANVKTIRTGTLTNLYFGRETRVGITLVQGSKRYNYRVGAIGEDGFVKRTGTYYKHLEDAVAALETPNDATTFVWD